jgi:hypothetical protein
MQANLVVRIAGASLVALAVVSAQAQGRPPTTEQLGKDPGALRQEAEQQRAAEQRSQQQQSQQQADQLYNDTLRQNQSRAAADMAQAENVRRTWQQRPPLAPDHNPLLGRWNSLGAGARQGNPTGLPPEMAQLANALVGNLTSGMCDSMLGRGTIDFRPNGVVAIGKDGSERPMYRAEYRGGGSRVVVLPQGGTTFTHMIIDFNGPDRATVAAVGCGLARAGAGTAKAALTSTALGMADSGGAAADWKLLGSSAANGGMDFYVAPASVRRSGDVARMLSMFDFKTRHTIDGKTFMSTHNVYEYDCARQRERMVATTGYAERMGKGVVVESTRDVLPWQPVGTSGPSYEHWKVACRRS